VENRAVMPTGFPPEVAEIAESSAVRSEAQQARATIDQPHALEIDQQTGWHIWQLHVTQSLCFVDRQNALNGLPLYQDA
jgi:hypothetical protein